MPHRMRLGDDKATHSSHMFLANQRTPSQGIGVQNHCISIIIAKQGSYFQPVTEPFVNRL